MELGGLVLNLQIIFHELVDLHDGSLVSASVAVVGGREDSHYVALVGPVVSVHDQLMGPRDPREVVRVVELLRDVLAEGVAGTSWADAPTASVIRVRPKKVANRSKQIALAELLSEENPYPSWGVSWTLSSCLI